MKCTKKIRDSHFVENGHLCKSDLSPCSAPMCTYEKVHKIKKIPFTLIYQVPKYQANISIAKKNGAHFSKCQKQPFFASFLVFSIYRGGGTPQTPSIIINIAPLGVRNFAQKFLGYSKFPRIWTLALSDIVPLKIP